MGLPIRENQRNLSAVTKKQWAIALALSALAVAVILGLSYWQLGNELDKSRSESKAAHNDADQANARALGFSNDWAQATGQVAALEKEKEAVANAQKSMEDQMKSALQSKDVTISQLQGKLTVNILDRILFDSGEASMKSEGEKVLRQIATVLSQFPRRQVHVVGHTDNIPIRAAARAGRVRR